MRVPTSLITLLFLAKPDSILLTREMAKREGIAIDQKIQVQTVQGIKTFTVRGLLEPDGPAKALGGDIAIMDIYAAQLAFGKDRRIDRIDVSIIRGETLDSVKGRIQSSLPQGYNIDTPAGRTRQIENFMGRFRKSMNLISFMALFVGMYLIYNTVSISVVQRRKEIGILRALGATRGQIMRTVPRRDRGACSARLVPGRLARHRLCQALDQHGRPDRLVLVRTVSSHGAGALAPRHARERRHRGHRERRCRYLPRAVEHPCSAGLRDTLPTVRHERGGPEQDCSRCSRPR